jgi:hypothetical protein
VRIQEPVGSTCNPAPARTGRRKRKKPFEAEYRLLAELGLRRN